jgi:signal transduction histidine kinase
LDKIELHTRQAIGTCRSIARGLSPIGYANGSLVDALQNTVRVQRDTFGVDIRFDAVRDASLRLATDASDQLYRIAQEAITNARRHAKARAITVTLDIQPANVRLEVLDDGIGLVSPAADSGGMGLKIMYFRASMIGARLSVRAGEHGGTLVTCECAQPASERLANPARRSASSH